MNRMKTLRYGGKKDISLVDVPVPALKENEVLIRVCCSALCGSERHEYEQDEAAPINPGHEFTGVIEDPNGSQRWKKGDRVTVHVTCGCGECYYCKIGMEQFCRKMKMVFGGHSEYVAAPERACLPIPEDMSQQEAVLLAADTIGVAYRAAKHVKGRPGTPVLITGAGPIGLGAVLLLKFLGYFIVVSEPSAYRRDYAKKIGADLVIDPLEQDLEAELKKITDDLGVEYVIECSGNARVQLQDLELVRCGGTVVFAGENSGTIPISPSGHFTRKELTLTGVWYQSVQDFAEITELFRKGLDVTPLISHSVSPAQAPEVGHMFYRGETAKVIINWSDEGK